MELLAKLLFIRVMEQFEIKIGFYLALQKKWLSVLKGLKEVIVDFWMPLLSSITTVGFAAIGISASPWLTKIDCATGYFSDKKVENACDIFSSWYILIWNWRSPHFWFAVCTLLAIVASLKSFMTARKIRKTQKQNSEYIANLASLDNLLAQERDEHAQTKTSYLSDIQRYMQKALPLDEIGFDDSCRVSIYREIPNNNAELKQIYRYARQPEYAQAGRIKIPSNEGVAGVVWNTLRTSSFTCDAPPKNKKHGTEFKRHYQGSIPDYETKAPPRHLKMPSRSFVGYRLCMPGRPDDRMAIIIIESISKNKFNAQFIYDTFDRDKIEIERITSIVSHLDAEFRPDGGA